MKTVVVYHSADADGWFCREIARKFLPNAELIGWDFKDKPINPSTLGNTLYVLDLPLDKPFGYKMEDLIQCENRGENRIGNACNVIWIDHHKSSIETHPAGIPGYRIDGVAACRLTWQWFNQNCEGYAINVPTTKEPYVERRVSEPLAVRLAGEYDIWDKRDPNAELFQHGLKSRNLDGMWASLLDLGHEGEKSVRYLLERGESIKYVRDQEYAEVIKQQGFEVKWHGIRFLACNSHELDIRSQLFEAGIEDYHEALLGFTFNGENWRVSMYHIPGKEHVDILSIAKANGGGGHAGACGCRVEKLPWI